MKFLDCPIWIPFSLRSKRPLCASAPSLISNSRETSVCSICQHCSGSIRVLRTGMWTFIGFDCFACGFRFWSSFFFCGFAVLQLWMIFSTALRFLMDPLILPYSGVPHGFLLCKLKISLSKITDLPFRSVPCLKLELAMFSYFFWNCMRNSFNFLLLIFFLIFLEISAVVFLTSHLNWNWEWGECGLKAGVSVPDSLILPLSALSCINFLIFHSSMNF